MTYRAVGFENVGPIADGEIRSHPINVFVGPSGAGKSIAARIIHGVCQLDASRAPYQLDLYTDRAEAVRRMASYMGHSIMKSAAIPPAGVPTHKRPSSSLRVDAGGRWPKRIDCIELKGEEAAAGGAPGPPPPPQPPPNGEMPSIYVPAGRTGIIQSLVGAVRAKSAMTGYAASHGRDRPAPGDARSAPAAKKPRAELEAGVRSYLPEYIGQFYDIVFRSVDGDPTRRGSRMVSAIFGGTVGKARTAGMPATTYKNQAGLAVEIASAAAGVLSPFPIAECAGRVQKGGMLIVEEPEAHLEPKRQICLVAELYKIAKERGFSLTLTTHSDYTLDSLLSLVACGQMRPRDLGLYYFKQKDGQYTRICPVAVEGDGTAEQELFDDAIAALASRFV